MAKKLNTLAPMLATVARAALNAATCTMTAADAVKIAFERHQPRDADGKPTERAKVVRASYMRGNVAGQVKAKVQRFSNAPDAELFAEADRIMALATYVKPDKGKSVPALPKGKTGRQSAAEAVMLGVARNGWSAVLRLAGYEALDNRGKASGKAKRESKAGQGATTTDDKTVAVPIAQAKALPPSKPNRETAIEYARVALAQVMLVLEKANQSAAKTRGAAIPPKIISDVQEWQGISKTWAC